jgi:hypothetical protein
MSVCMEKNQQNMLAPTNQQRQKDPSSYENLRSLSMIMMCIITPVFITFQIEQ